jgi:hypothetical protein
MAVELAHLKRMPWFKAHQLLEAIGHVPHAKFEAA